MTYSAEYKKKVEKANAEGFIIEYRPKKKFVPPQYRDTLKWYMIKYPEFDWEHKDYRIAEPKRKKPITPFGSK